MKVRPTPAVAAAVVLAAAATTLAGTAQAAPATPAAAGPAAPAPALAEGLLSPLSVAATGKGVVYVSQNFAGQLMEKKPGGRLKRVHGTKDGAEVGAVSVSGRTVYFAESRGDNEEGVVRTLDRRTGKVRTLADIGAFEAEANPDGATTYGFQDISEECEGQLPEGFPASYTGVDETHPYATTTDERGRVIVADAGANALFTVSRRGTVSAVAALPSTDLEISAEFAAANDLPECVAGLTYAFEAVPTDVEVGPGGDLYVSTLPGGPEDGSLGPAATVLRVDPASGTSEVVADGLVSLTGIDVARNGDVYTAELFPGVISRFPAGGGEREVVRETAFPGDVELAGGSLYATVNVLSGLSGEEGDVPDGRVVRIRL